MNKATKLAEWATSVKERDGKCRHCQSPHDLHAHHIKPKSTHPELSLDPDNGLTLCYRCHKAEHERNRPLRVRSNKPHRSTLQKQVDELGQRVREAETRNRELQKRIGQCERGSCPHGLELSRVRNE